MKHWVKLVEAKFQDHEWGWKNNIRLGQEESSYKTVVIWIQNVESLIPGIKGNETITNQANNWKIMSQLKSMIMAVHMDQTEYLAQLRDKRLETYLQLRLSGLVGTYSLT